MHSSADTCMLGGFHACVWCGLMERGQRCASVHMDAASMRIIPPLPQQHPHALSTAIRIPFPCPYMRAHATVICCSNSFMYLRTLMPDEERWARIMVAGAIVGAIANYLLIILLGIREEEEDKQD